MPLQFLRKNQKWILVVGGTLLMIAFLAPSGVSFFQGQQNPQNAVVGRIDQTVLRVSDSNLASYELSVLGQLKRPVALQGRSIFGMLNPVNAESDDDRATHWVLMLAEAKQMGLVPTVTQGRYFAYSIGLDDKSLKESFGEKSGLEPIFMAISKWLVLQDYREMMLGLGHVSMQTRASGLNNVYMILQNPQAMTNPQFTNAAFSMMGGIIGNSRVSEPIARRFVTESNAKVWVEGFKLPLDRTLETAVATESVKADLFEKHKDELKGVSKPFGFGYKVPDQVKLEYLTLDINGANGLKRLVVSQVKPAELKRFYEEHKDQLFKRSAAAIEADKKAGDLISSEYRGYRAVFDEIKDIVMTQKATELGIWAMGEARTMMITEAKQKLSSNDGFYDTSRKSWKPMSLEKVADAIRVKLAKRLNINESESVTPVVKVLNRDWMSSKALEGVTGLGEKYADAGVIGKVFNQRPALNIPFGSRTNLWFELGDYATTVRELNNEKRDLRFKRLQTTIASKALVMLEESFAERLNPTGLMLFRVTDVLPSHAPESMAEVDAVLTEDAKRVDAFEKLKAQGNELREAFENGKAEDLAKAWKVELFKSDGFTCKVATRGQGGKLATPYVYGVGQDESFVTEAFNIADEIHQAGGVEMSEKDARTIAEPIEEDMSLVVAEVVKIDLMKASAYRDAVSDESRTAISNAVSSMLADVKGTDALAFDAVVKRVNYMDEDDYQKAKEGGVKSESSEKNAE